MEKLITTSLDFPTDLLGIEKPPKHLFTHGDIEHLKGPLISVVGAREMRPWVKEWMENELLPVLKEEKVGVVSGGARGTDHCAHSMALRAQVPTVVVVPSGLNHLYPKTLNQWWNNRNVLFLSEYEADQPMLKFHFHNRNRIVVGLTPITLVIQAKEKSGTMISARLAQDMGKLIATIPANPLESGFSGNNQLLYEGAALVRNSGDLKALIHQSFCGRSDS